MKRLGIRKLITSKYFFTPLVAFLVFYLSTCVGLKLFEIKIILAPTSEIPETPLENGLTSHDLEIPAGEASSGSTSPPIHAHWIPAKDPDAPVVLYLHGQDATIGKNLDHAELLYELGCSILLIDYRGFGESFGKYDPSEASVYADALSALKYLKNDLEIASHRIFVLGHSLGGAVAIDLATQEECSDIAGLIVESSFTSILEMSSERYFGLLQFFPIKYLLTQHFDSLSKIGQVTLPVLFIHGDQDLKVPHWMTKKLHSVASDPKDICIIPGAGHENCGKVGDEEYQSVFLAFVAECLTRAERNAGVIEPASP